jgi:eukaryotic-like serine/threonine-protein kinase
MHTPHLQCDAAIVGRYLAQQLSAAEEVALETHLDHCETCRAILGRSAADDSWWSEASRFLPSDEWDGPVSLTLIDVASGTTSGSGRTPRDDASLVRRLAGWLDPTDDPRMLGRFGGYEIAGVIGEGGMGIVLKGHEPALNRFVAIKVLAPHLASNGAARQRFAREAQAAAAVLHENVIAIHRVDESQGLPYLVMPYIAGVSLQTRLDREGPLPLVAVLRIGRQIAAGLAAAHAQGLVHRDVKPANILLERGVDRVTLTDFGLARAVDDATVTRSGMIAGTPQYMSPEQARGDAIDVRSDLFSLGSVIYAMCTGRPPFRAETSYGILRRITDNEPRPIRAINPDIPAWLEGIVARLHAKWSGDRFQTPDEIAELLEQCLAHVQQPTVVPLPALAASLAVPPPGGNGAGTTEETTNISLRDWRLWLAATAGALVIGLFILVWSPPEPLPVSNERLPIPPDATIDEPPAPPVNIAAEQWEDRVGTNLESIGTDLERLDRELKDELKPELGTEIEKEPALNSEERENGSSCGI